MSALLLKSESFPNPLDVAELVVMDRDWSFDRVDDGELVAEVNGVWSNWRVWFNWQEEHGGLTFSCAFDAKMPKQALPKAYMLLALVNDRMWLGHFSINTEDSTIMFRHSVLLRDDARLNAEQVQELLDIAIQECERFYPALQAVAWGGQSPAQALEAALFETVAEA